MAINLPKIKFLANADAKTRILVLLGSVFVLFFAFFLIFRYLAGGADTTDASKVASAPAGMQSVPGGQLTPEFYKSMTQASAQAAQQAQMTGGSAVPSLINVPGQPAGFPRATTDCTVLCPGDEAVNVADDINNLSQQGKLSQDEANRLLELAKNNASIEEYAAALDELVRQGKLAAEQARVLLEKYKKQHQNALVAESAKTMDALIKSGQLPVAVANELLDLQKKKLTPAEYAAELARLAREGKVSPEMAAQLSAQYTQQQAQEAAKKGAVLLQQMAKSGQITPDVASDLLDFQKRNAPVDQYAAELNRLIAAGKMTPATAAKLLDQYKQQKMGLATTGTLGQLIAKGGAEADEAKRLLNMQGNNASLNDYMNELKRAVQAGTITPEMAAALLKEYQAMMTPLAALGTLPAVEGTIPGAEDFAKLQQRVQQPTAPPTPVVTQEFEKAQAQSEAEAQQQRLQRIQELQAAMASQAQSLTAAWQPSAMQGKVGAPPKAASDSASGTGAPGSTAGGKSGKSAEEETAPPLIKAGTILFGVLETAVNSDYPDTPVMITIVQGKFKDAKLLGKLALAQGMDKVSLNFTLMDMENWPKSLPVTAFAMDPDTARTVLASNVDYHYMLRYGSMFASSFLTGYANAVSNSGSSSTISIFGTSKTNPTLSPASKLAVALGQVGTTLGNAMAAYFNTPTTVKVNAGVGLAVLFMADVTQ